MSNECSVRAQCGRWVSRVVGGGSRGVWVGELGSLVAGPLGLDSGGCDSPEVRGVGAVRAAGPP